MFVHYIVITVCADLPCGNYYFCSINRSPKQISGEILTVKLINQLEIFPNQVLLHSEHFHASGFLLSNFLKQLTTNHQTLDRGDNGDGDKRGREGYQAGKGQIK